MKNEEDEAFDDLAKRQGDWGGGFPAKRKMVMDKIHAEFYEKYVRYRTAFPKEYTAPQPAQEPPSEWAGIKAILDEYGLQAIDFVADFKAALAQPAQEPVAWTTMPEAEDWCFVSGNKNPNGKLEGKWFPLYTIPPQRERVVFPTMLRKMWSGGEVQAWLDENVNKEKNNGT